MEELAPVAYSLRTSLQNVSKVGWSAQLRGRREGCWALGRWNVRAEAAQGPQIQLVKLHSRRQDDRLTQTLHLRLSLLQVPSRAWTAT